MSSSLQHVVDAEELVDPAPKPIRRSFTTEYRHRVVAEYEAAPHGEKSAVLRREGLYQSQVREWRAERDATAALDRNGVAMGKGATSLSRRTLDELVSQLIAGGKIPLAPASWCAGTGEMRRTGEEFSGEVRASGVAPSRIRTIKGTQDGPP